MQQQLKKIVVLGPESTGKSTLCTQLASHYKTNWCPEYAREYLLQHGTDYSFGDLLTIARGQLALEDSYARQVGSGKRQEGGGTEIKELEKESLPVYESPTPNPQSLRPAHSPLATHHSLFIDTDMYVMKVWCEFVFGQCHSFILDQIVERKYDLYLFCKPDLPWVQDALREYPDLVNREKLFHMYKDLLINQTTPWAEISGDYHERLSKAISAVDAIF